MPDEPQETAPLTPKAPKRRRPRRGPNFLLEAEVGQLVTAAQQASDGARTPAKRRAATRDLIAVRCFLATGLRVSELCRLRIEHLDLAAGVLAVYGGKGGKDAVLPLSAKLLPHLAAWIGERREGWVFEGRRGQQLSVRRMQARITALGMASGLLKRVKCHSMRHTFITELLNKGVAIQVARDLARHESIATTNQYAWARADQLRDGVNKL